jgi:hypothetical protein
VYEDEYRVGSPKLTSGGENTQDFYSRASARGIVAAAGLTTPSDRNTAEAEV